MTAPAPSVVVSDDGEGRVLINLDVLSWRYEEMLRAGFPASIAVELSQNPDVDLHEACDLLNAGATLQQAVRILT